MPKTKISFFDMTQTILAERHPVLRRELLKAAGLTGVVVLEQRPPLCDVFLPLYRLFQEFRQELEEYLELQSDLFPRLLDLEKRLSIAEPPFSPVEQDLEIIRMLHYGQAALSGGLQEMRELTRDFTSPYGACASYKALVAILAVMEEQLVPQFRYEAETLYPRAINITRRAARSAAGAPAESLCL